LSDYESRSGDEVDPVSWRIDQVKRLDGEQKVFARAALQRPLAEHGPKLRGILAEERGLPIFINLSSASANPGCPVDVGRYAGDCSRPLVCLIGRAEVSQKASVELFA